MRGWLDIILGNYQWYRRKRGGTWHLVTVRAIAGFGECWIRGETNPSETILRTERYE